MSHQPIFCTVRLYWAWDNFGFKMIFLYESCPRCRIDHSSCWSAVQYVKIVPWLPRVWYVTKRMQICVTVWLNMKSQVSLYDISMSVTNKRVSPMFPEVSLLAVIIQHITTFLKYCFCVMIKVLVSNSYEWPSFSFKFLEWL